MNERLDAASFVNVGSTDELMSHLSGLEAEHTASKMDCIWPAERVLWAEMLISRLVNDKL